MNRDRAMAEQRMLAELKAEAQRLAERYDLETGQPAIELVKRSVQNIMGAERMTLDLYGVRHRTDKSSLLATADGSKIFASHDYLRHYEPFFRPWRDEDIVLIEFGCDRGASLRLWEEYFSRAAIYGVDIETAAKAYANKRIHIVLGDATEQKTYDVIQRDMGGRKAAIIMDDASHAWCDQQRTLSLFWEMLAPGGIYIIEDLECGTNGAYANYTPKAHYAQPFFEFMQDRCRALRWTQYKADWEERRHQQLPEWVRRLEREMDLCQFIPSAIILRKRDDAR